MNTNALKKFATEARVRLIEQVGTKLEYVLNIDTAELRDKAKQIRELQKQIDASSKHAVVERVAYTWFNRFMALRFMDANGYTTVKSVAPVEGHTLPELLAEAKMGNIDPDLKVDREKINDLLDGRVDSQDPQTEVYKLLLVAVCNSYNTVMPFMFEAIKDYTELLMPDDLLGDGSILNDFVVNMTDEGCRNVEVVGWLYQFYISEKKDEVMARKKAVPKGDIPAVTQLFTPHWIVRYLVENSLGRLWMLNRPNSRLKEQMDYYIKAEEEETDFLLISSPEELKICDPACGSGHMLVYAFDLLYAIYEEEGYDPPEIPRLILEKNLYGIEIDERAGELAAFALFMKAREKYQRFFKKPVQPQICVLENIKFNDEELEAYMDKIGRDLFTVNLRETLHQFEEADNFGSLIRPATTNATDILQILKSKNITGELFLHGVHKRVLKALQQADYLSPKYHVVVTNPPYIDLGNMNQSLKIYIKTYYELTKQNLDVTFLALSISLCVYKGFSALITQRSWMFLSRIEDFRRETIAKHGLVTMIYLGPRTFPEIQGEKVQNTAFVFQKNGYIGKKSYFFRLTAGQGKEKQRALLERKHLYIIDIEKLADIPGYPIAFWASEALCNAFCSGKSLNDIAEIRVGLDTGDNASFIRNWHELSLGRIGFGARSLNEFQASKDRWVPHSKGGPYRKWYGNIKDVLAFGNDDYHLLLNQGNKLPSRQFYFKSGLFYSRVSSENISLRFAPEGVVFNSASPTVFPEDKYQSTVFALLNSKVVNVILECLSPTLNFQAGELRKLPLPVNSVENEVSKVVAYLTDCTKLDWDAYETSWDFTTLPLLKSDYCQPTLKATRTKIHDHWREITLEMQRLEEESNSIFIEAYGLQEELTPEIPLEEITLTSNPRYRYGGKKTDEELEALLLADTMREFISYAVGCMLGRYSIDKPGLILANQEETLKDYLRQVPNPTFLPDDDNVIPVLDDEYFTDDIVWRFKKFLKVTFGEKYYDENLAFIESAIGKDIRKYFLHDFYNHHVKIYKKRPIYWMFSSPKKSFNVLIYMHRYRSDTVSRILNEYLREFQEKLRARKVNQQEISISESASTSEKSKANREIERIDKVLAELDDYERNVLFPLAGKKIEIDLDDGVKVNYNKFGDALRKIPGLSGK